MPSLRDLARITGLSVATVSRALRNDPAVRPGTRDAVHAAAQEAGYNVNPHVGQLMSSLRRQRGESFRGNLALIWIGGAPPNGRHSLNLIRRAVADRAAELGYSLDELVIADFEADRLIEILRSRGIGGIVFSPPYRALGKTHLRLPLDGFASVSLGWGVLRPSLDTVRFDHYQAMRLAIHHARRHAGGGIAALWDFAANRRADHTSRASFLAHHPAGTAVAEELFLDHAHAQPTRVLGLLKRHGVQCILTNAGSGLPAWLESWAAEHGVVYCRDSGGKRCLGWIDSQHQLLGRWGVDMLTSALQRNERGVPDQPKTMLVPSRWVGGERKASFER